MTIPKILPRTAVQDMIDEANLHDTRRGRRDALIIMLLGRCALRSIEARYLAPANLRVDESGVTWLDLTRVKRTVRDGTTTRRGRKRSIPCQPDVADALHAWIARDYRGGPTLLGGTASAMGRSTLYDAVTRISLDAGYPDCSPHMLRHTCISDWMQSGRFSTHGVMAMSGHKNSAQLDVYLHARPEDLAEGMLGL